MAQQVEVKDQVRLSLAKCVELVLSGLRFRLFRAAVTVVIISLAVAFLMTMLTRSLSTTSVASLIDSKTEPRRKLTFWLGWLSSPMSDAQLTSELAVGNPQRKAEFQTWGGLDDQQTAKLTDVAKRQREYLKFFAKLSEGQRTVLVGRNEDSAMFAYLAKEENFREYRKQIAQCEQQMAQSVDEFAAFVADWAATRPLRQQVLAGHAKALEEVKKLPDGKDVKQFLATIDADKAGKLAALGFRMSAGDMPILREQAQLAVDAEVITKTLSVKVLKSRLATRLSVDPTKISAELLLNDLTSSSGANWFTTLTADEVFTKPALEQSIVLPKLSVDRVREVSSKVLEDSGNAEVEARVKVNYSEEGWLGFSGRTLWLVLVSFFVCVVGIANAMLMSVTERFREIATMKCLGATDGFIMTNFIMESCMQGLAGGVAGSILGFGLGLLLSWLSYGWMAVSNLPGVTLLVAGLLAVVTGVVLSAMAALYPAWIAARLAPMEAMRIE